VTLVSLDSKVQREEVPYKKDGVFVGNFEKIHSLIALGALKIFKKGLGIVAPSQRF